MLKEVSTCSKSYKQIKAIPKFPKLINKEPKIKKIKDEKLPANPSNPSNQLIAFVKPAIHKTLNKILIIGTFKIEKYSIKLSW